MRSSLRVGVLSVLLPVALEAQSLREQTSAQQSQSREPSQIISANPFLPLWGYLQVEYERRLNTNASFALAGSHTAFDDDVYTNLDAKIRLYPQEVALRGLGFAASLGFANIRRASYEDCSFLVPQCSTVAKHTVSAPTFAIEGQYQWLLGSHKATAATLGFGVKRYFVSANESHDKTRVLPTGRLSIGYAY